MTHLHRKQEKHKGGFELGLCALMQAAAKEMRFSPDQKRTARWLRHRCRCFLSPIAKLWDVPVCLFVNHEQVKRDMPTNLRFADKLLSSACATKLKLDFTCATA